MKVLNGPVKLGTYENTEVLMDFGRLLKYKGEAGKRIHIERNFGKILWTMAILLFIGSFILLLSSGELSLSNIVFPKKILHLLPYISIPILLYSFYLRRNRDIFWESLKEKDLPDVLKLIKGSQIKRVFLEDSMNVSLIGAIDFYYFSANGNFFQRFAKYIFENRKNRDLLERRLGINFDNFMKAAYAHLNSIDTSFDYNFPKIFFNSFIEALYLEALTIDETVLFFAMLKYYFSQVLLDFNVSDLEVQGLKIWQKNESRKEKYYRLWKKFSKLKPIGNVNKSFTSKATPTLNEYGQDLTASSVKGNFATSIGRDTEMNSMLRILQKENSGSAVLLLGEPGIGKSRIIKHLATKMSVEDVPKMLQDSRLVQVDLNKVLVKTQNVDTFKNVLQKMLEEVHSSGNIILVFEEFTQLFNIREDGRMEIINIIVNSIDQFKLKIIATTNQEAYTKFIKPVKNLASVFETVLMAEPTSNLSLQILIDEVGRFEDKYKTKIQINAIKKIVEFAPRFESERFMPDKGLDLLEEALVNARSQNLEYLSVDIVDQLISSKVGVNVGAITKDEATKLTELEDIMHGRVIGQDDAIKSIAMAIRRSRAGLSDFKKRPVASFLFFGPTGVGKTESAKTLAEVYFGSENLMIRVDMSEYQEENNLGRLIGYMDDNGNLIGGYLTEAVKSKPFSLVLLDEIEKANKKVLDLFLQVLDDGFLTDGMGRKVDFTNTIIIMTSNAASSEIAKFVESGENYNEIYKEVLPLLRNTFRVEFLNRFDKVIMFKSLNKAEIREVVEINLKHVNEGLKYKGISITWNDKTLDELAELAYNPVYGAREMRRVLQDNVEDMLANLIIQGRLKSGMEVQFDGIEVSNIKN